MRGRVPAALRRAGSTVVHGRPALRARFTPGRSRLIVVLGLLGPGLIAANAGNDAGGIATYSHVGAKYGYGLLWMMVVITVSLAIVQAMARSRQDRELSLTVLQKYLKNDNPHALGVTYDFFVGEVTPQYPQIRVEQFTDAITQLSASNDKIKGFDVTSIIDSSFVNSTMDRKLGEP